MKNKKYYIIRTVPISDRETVETEVINTPPPPPPNTTYSNQYPLTQHMTINTP